MDVVKKNLALSQVKTRGQNPETVTERCSQEQIESLKEDHCPQ